MKSFFSIAWRLYLKTGAALCKLIDRLCKGRDLPYYCPCCNTRLYWWRRGRYGKHPSIYNPERYKVIPYNTLCPVCNSMPRHRIVIEYLKRLNLEKFRILYFAIEEGISIWLKVNGISFTSADLYKDADLKIDMEKTGLEEGAYDLIICNHVLEHVKHYRSH